MLELTSAYNVLANNGNGVFVHGIRSIENTSGKLLYSARIIPYRGSWFDFDFDLKECIYVRIDRKKKLPVTILLKAMNFSIEKIQMALNIDSKAESNIYIGRVGCHEKINIVPLSQTHNK